MGLASARKRRSLKKKGVGLLVLLAVGVLLAYALNYYRLHRPTSEADIARIESLIASGKGDEARDLMAVAQARSKDLTGLRLRIGRAFLREGYVGPATALLSKVEESLMKEERLAIAEYFLVAGDPFSSARFYDAALKAGMPRSASILGRYGEALAQSANREAAVAAFQESLALDDSRNRVRLSLAVTLAKLNRRDEARVETLRVLRSEPTNAKALELLAALGQGP